MCGRPLHEVSHIPVCPACLCEPAPLDAEFFCVSCRTPFQNRFPLDEEGRCALCRGGLRGFDAAYSFGFYDGVLRQLIHLYKYGKVRTLAGPLGDFLLRALPRDESFDCVAPVPLHWRKRWRRGFNQADLLSRRIASRTGIPVSRLLRRRRSTASQASLSNTGRRRNVASAFTCRRPDRAAGRKILLIDDVMTTGSTGAACALALKRAGAARVALLTVARADRRFPSSLRASPSVMGGAS
ncbi:MAG: ComF family protein [Bryobacteraceae bacterium]